MARISIGIKAPQFSLPDGDGKYYSLKQFLGKKVILYFYPQDDTETCTAQACSFRDRLSEFEQHGAQLLGISPDDVKSHKKFSLKYGLNFPILSDEDKNVMNAYGVWKKKLMFGKKYMGVIRTTFIINEKGSISHIFPKVRIKNHADKILEVISQ